jgi:hypothetical protein
MLNIYILISYYLLENFKGFIGIRMKSKEKIEWELTILKRKRPLFVDLKRKTSGSCISFNDFVIEGRIIALEWVLGSPSFETKHRMDTTDWILTEIDLCNFVSKGMRSIKEVYREISKVKKNLSPYKTALNDEMTAFERINAKMVPYGDQPIAYIMIGMKIALDWVVLSPFKEAKDRAKRNRNTPRTAGSYPMRECYIKPKR